MFTSFCTFILLLSFNIIEQKILSKASIVICSSQWAANSAVHRYHINPQKVFVLPRGANFNSDPSINFVRKRLAACNLLFVGKNWERKGGSIAYDAFSELKQTGLDVHLTIIGCSPSLDEPGVTIIPHINKNIKEDYNRYLEILDQTTFLILPTRAECSAIAIAESSAFGIPSIATDTGGLSTSVLHKKTGHLLSKNSKGKEYAKIIKNLYFDWENYEKLSMAARSYYKNEMNWASWSQRLKNILDEHMHK